MESQLSVMNILQNKGFEVILVELQT